nr:LuxR C-terminal-related transcriptional regulator [Nocardia panacis]
MISAGFGAGKSALLRFARERAGADRRVLTCSGVESEAELSFSGLHMLFGGVLDRIDALPGAQREALGGALGLIPGREVDRFRIGAATLALLVALAAEGPVLCSIDDAHLLDRSTLDALRFAARRLDGTRVVMLFAGCSTLADIPEIGLQPLDADAAETLLRERRPELSADQRDRVVAESAGNPLALLEFPCVDPSVPGPLPLPSGLAARFATRIAREGRSVRQALLVAAAEETGDLGLVLRASRLLGHGIEPLERTDMVLIEGRSVTFHHPMLRSAAYHCAPLTQRHAVHTAIADAVADPARRAWHLAAAQIEPDEALAAALEVTADHSRHAAVVLERAAQLTPAPGERARRLMLAIEAATHSGSTERAQHLVREARRSGLGAVERARVVGARAFMEFEDGSPRRAFQLTMASADHVAEVEPARAAWLLVEASRIAWSVGDRASYTAVYERLEGLSSDAAGSPRAVVRSGLAVLTGDPGQAVAVARANLAHAGGIPAESISPRLAFAFQAALTGDMAAAGELFAALFGAARERGMIGWLPAIGAAQALCELVLGRFREAEAVAREAAMISARIGHPNRASGAESILAVIAAVRGDQDECLRLTDRILRGYHGVYDVSLCQWALALLDLGRGFHEKALVRLEALHRRPAGAVGPWLELRADLVEAAARANAPERGFAAMTELEQWAEALDTPWADALLCTSHGLLRGDGDLLARALETHLAAGQPFRHARTALAYGEWLRRERRTSEARTHLGAALEIFDRVGADLWAERARTELRAAGAGSITASPNAVALLTPQELRVVRIAAEGATNKEIAARLSLSHKTVGHHLYRAFPKLGVSNRIELTRFDFA